ncbi:unnamed protein product (macronuclear) [Paramecium tetraurelia]|uniref:Uncharacterized protein n=1 Tax=Paramecium tetraurelia TaxID=5888 RepID=A0EHP2_PARTE|nr:uncharacterized protein GSPATT00027159001 [Paramecium tetraurelia]CAK94833.1 unnamed protein product [Paramecium tetraurelia]|eukprot:XP_001462206.1 hypothetical protein (macronuclear) [Paramecium tetraurelia strain d4-2]
MNNFSQQNQCKQAQPFLQQGNQPMNQFPYLNKNQQPVSGQPQNFAPTSHPTLQQGQVNPSSQFNQFNQQNQQSFQQPKPAGQFQAQAQFGNFINNQQIPNNNANPPNYNNFNQNNFNQNIQKPQVIQIPPKADAKFTPNSINLNQQGANKYQIQPQKPQECETKPIQQFQQQFKDAQAFGNIVPQQSLPGQSPLMQPRNQQQKYPRVDVKSEEDKKQLVKSLNQYFKDGNSEFVIECIKQIIENDIRVKLPEQAISIK